MGTSHVFPYINAPVMRAFVEGRTTVLVNPEPVLGAVFSHHLVGGAVEGLGRLAEVMGLEVS